MFLFEIQFYEDSFDELLVKKSFYDLIFEKLLLQLSVNKIEPNFYQQIPFLEIDQVELFLSQIFYYSSFVYLYVFCQLFTKSAKQLILVLQLFLLTFLRFILQQQDDYKFYSLLLGLLSYSLNSFQFQEHSVKFFEQFSQGLSTQSQKLTKLVFLLLNTGSLQQVQLLLDAGEVLKLLLDLLLQSQKNLLAQGEFQDKFFQ
ncbi:hypothetical protein TTHERM_000372449 (macronuclear) [Tetrahymena thermophila SB210]|uniref:Uncharacterized protein n=1 Tax=Tetrahymena thermophila (strain SB210) TaxID=312017 RepID=W7XLB8_TETTS|nr:hypothetical protein TTHERM_000372449 [Tetrahymena thermophila SB210]EWS76014.1 hypothetical protein TTHERM_000372449 [Tetrahymena thermophila SB210]|eukprot:XP_012651452.1 hypothetical protein TTHERM_000372449 [Tetrahymena thermophila SB210]